MMKKKLLAICLIAIFLLTGFNAVSAGNVEKKETCKEASEPLDLDIQFQKSYVSFFLIDYEFDNFKVTTSEGEKKVSELIQNETYDDVYIEGYQNWNPEDCDLPSYAYALFGGQLSFLIVIYARAISLEFAIFIDKILPQTYLFKEGNFTIHMTKMTVQTILGEGTQGAYLLRFAGSSGVEIYQ